MLQTQTVNGDTLELLKNMTWKQVKKKVSQAVKKYLERQKI